MRLFVAQGILLSASMAAATPSAEDAASPDGAPPGETDEHTAGPGDSEARGVEKEEHNALRGVAGVFPRAILYVPGVLLDTVAWPLRWAAVGVEKTRAPERIAEWLCDDKMELCVYPTALVETGFGPNIGARLSHTNLLGGRENLALRAGFGGQFRQRYSGRLHVPVGDRSHVRLRTSYQIQPDQYFYGFGTQDLETEAPVMPPVGLDEAFETRYLMRRFYALVLFGHEIARMLEGSFSLSFEHADFGPPEGSAAGADEIYGEAAIPGFETGVRQILPQLGLVLETRDEDTTGVRAAFYGGPAIGVGEDRARFVHWEGSLAGHIEVLRPRRIVSVGATALGVVRLGDRPVPFIDRAELGGPHLLRGYRLGRFRDDGALVFVAQYRWPIHHVLDAYLFAEAGRTYAKPEDVTLDGMKPSFGGGLGLHTRRNITARLQIARGEEEAQVLFVLEPAFERQDPQERGQ